MAVRPPVGAERDVRTRVGRSRAITIHPPTTARRPPRLASAGLFPYIEEPPASKVTLPRWPKLADDAKPKARTDRLAAVTTSAAWFASPSGWPAGGGVPGG